MDNLIIEIVIMINQKIGKWLVISDEGIIKGYRHFLCECECGTRTKKRKEAIYKYSMCKSCRSLERSKIKETLGFRFGNWTVLSLDQSKKLTKYYVCKCDCGHISSVRGHALRTGASKLCIRCRASTHKKSYSNVYNIWHSMLQRCNNPNDKGYHNYGGRGIKVCTRWHTFINFYDDMGEKPHDKEIDRINNDGNYEPSNCRWATRKENSKNRRNNKKLH